MQALSLPKMEGTRIRPMTAQNHGKWLCFIALLGALCAVTVFRSHALLAHNSFALVPPDSFSIYKADFICFYAAARVGLENLSLAYNVSALHAAQAAITNAVGAENPFYVFSYPPFIEIIFRQLLWLSYERAYYAWLGIIYASTACFVGLLWQNAHSWRERILAGILIPAGFPFFSFHALMAGQTTVFAVAIMALMVWAQKKSSIMAGLLCGLGIYKPPLFVVLGILAIMKGDWRFVSGAVLSASVVVGLSTICIGVEPFIAFLKVASGYMYGGTLPDGRTLPATMGMGLLSALVGITKSNSLGWVLFAGLSTLAIWTHHRMVSSASKREAGSDIYETCSSIILTYLLSVQAIDYDAAVLIVPVTLILASLRERSSLSLMLILSISFVMVAGILETKNGNSVCPGFIAVTMFWFAVISTWRHRHTSTTQSVS